MIYHPTFPADGQANACSLPLEQIQPRASLHAMQEGSLRGLMASIRQEGLHRPILVRQTGPRRYIVVSGNRRLMACRRLGLSQINATVLPALPDSLAPSGPSPAPPVPLLLAALSSHTWHYLDEAAMMHQLNTRHGMTREDIARALYLTALTVTSRLELLVLSEPLRAFLMEEGLPECIAHALLRLPDDTRRMHVAHRSARERLCIREVEALITSTLTRQSVPRAPTFQPRRQPRHPRAGRTAAQGRRVLTLMRDTRPYINAIRDITAQMRVAGLEATLTEKNSGGQHELTLRF